MFKLQNSYMLGFISSCVNPVLDIQISTQNLNIKYLELFEFSSFVLDGRHYSPGVYDIVLTKRPSFNCREGVLISNSNRCIEKFIVLLFNQESLLLALICI